MRKVVLVTSCQSRSGDSIVLEFAKHGYDVVIHSCEEEEKTISLQKEVEETYAGKCLIWKGDFRKEEEIPKLIEEVLSTFGRLDVLVNCAEIKQEKSFFEETMEDLEETLGIYVVGNFLISKYVGEIMVHQKQGAIINLIENDLKNSLEYDTSKAGILSLTHNLALQFAPYIRVNAVLSGEERKETMVKEKQNHSENRFAKAEEIAHLVYFLASDDASYINNSVIKVNREF